MGSSLVLMCRGLGYGASSFPLEHAVILINRRRRGIRRHLLLSPTFPPAPAPRQRGSQDEPPWLGRSAPVRPLAPNLAITSCETVHSTRDPDSRHSNSPISMAPSLLRWRARCRACSSPIYVAHNIAGSDWHYSILLEATGRLPTGVDHRDPRSRWVSRQAQDASMEKGLPRAGARDLPNRG